MVATAHETRKRLSADPRSWKSFLRITIVLVMKPPKENPNTKLQITWPENVIQL